MSWLNEQSSPHVLLGRVNELEAALRVILRAAEKAGIVEVYLRRSDDRCVESELGSALRWAFAVVNLELPEALR